MRRRFLLLWALAIALASVWPYRLAPRLSYCGIDTPVLVEIHRPGNGRELLAGLTREFRDGVEPDVAFYRPWTSSSYVGDAWWHGVDPRGYHVTDVALFAACAVALFVFLATAGAPAWMAAVGGLWFAWHPLAVEVVPVPARRSDLWVVLWLLLAGLGWLRDREGARAWRVLWITSGVLATLSKESGFLLPLLLLALPSATRRARRRVALGMLAILPGLLLRWMVIGRAGGYGAFSVSGMVEGLRVLVPVSGGPLGGWILVPALVLALLLWRARDCGAVRVLALWSLAWIGATLLLYCFAGRIGARYLLALLPALAALLTAAFMAGRAARLLATAVVALSLDGSPAWTSYPGWSEVSGHMEAWMRFPPPAEETIVVAGLPHDLALQPPPRYRVRAASIWRDFSLESAWRLRHGRSPRVIDAAPVRVTQAGAAYAVRARRTAEGWAFTLQGGGVRFVASPDGRVEVGGLADPVFVWNDGALQRVEEPPRPKK